LQPSPKNKKKSLGAVTLTVIIGGLQISILATRQQEL